MYKCLKFDLARNALRYLVRTYKIKEINIPYYLCDVVRHTLYKEQCKIKYYHIDDNFMPSNEFNNEDFILYPNYFGVYRKNAENLVKKYPNLILDNAHAYFDAPLGVASFNAGHKFGYKDSFLWVKDDKGNETKEVKDKKDKLLRQELFDKLCQKYNSSNLLKFNYDAIPSPFVYPYLADTEKAANELVKELESKGNIIYRYWNPMPKNFNEYKFYARLVPIPINIKHN